MKLNKKIEYLKNKVFIARLNNNQTYKCFISDKYGEYALFDYYDALVPITWNLNDINKVLEVIE